MDDETELADQDLRVLQWMTGRTSRQNIGWLYITSRHLEHTWLIDSRSKGVKYLKKPTRNLGSCHSSVHVENFFSSKSFLADGFLPSPFLVSVVSDLLLGVASDLVNVEEARLFFLSEEAFSEFFLSPVEASVEVFVLSIDAVLVLVGTLGVLTGSMGLPVRDRLPKKRMGFSGLIFANVAVAGGGVDSPEFPPSFLSPEVSNFARPFATAPFGMFISEESDLASVVSLLDCAG